MTISDIQKKATPIFKQYGISSAGIFGSFAKNEQTKKSDVDFIVKLGKPMGIFLYMRFVHDLEKKLRRNVDVVTEKSLNKRVKPYIMNTVQMIYED